METINTMPLMNQVAFGLQLTLGSAVIIGLFIIFKRTAKVYFQEIINYISKNNLL